MRQVTAICEQCGLRSFHIESGWLHDFHGERFDSTDTDHNVVLDAELGLMVGAADPMMLFPQGTTFTPYSVLRNVSGVPLSLTPTLWWMEGGAPRSAQLPRVGVAPYQSRNLDIPALLALYGPKNFNGSLNLVFTGNILPGSLVLASGSVDQTNTYVFESIGRGIGESASKSLQYWSTASGDDTMFTLWNPADEAQDFIFTLYFKGGHYLYPIHLEPRATRAFNVSEIIQNQAPDAEGNVIPPSVHEGSAEFPEASPKTNTFSLGWIPERTMFARQPAATTARSAVA